MDIFIQTLIYLCLTFSIIVIFYYFLDVIRINDFLPKIYLRYNKYIKNNKKNTKKRVDVVIYTKGYTKEEIDTLNTVIKTGNYNDIFDVVNSCKIKKDIDI